MSTLVAGYPVDERGVWHHNGPPFFLEVRHLSLDSAFQTLLHKQKATQCVNLSLIQQYKDKDSQHKDDDSSKKLCLHLSRVPMSSAWNQTLCGLLLPELPSCRNALDTQHKQPHDP